jgi:hypothetical protein
MVGELIKNEVIAMIAGTSSIVNLPKAKVRIGQKIVHIRFRTKAKTDGLTYAFNVNPNTLKSDFELWVCGSPNCYYLIPISEIGNIYHHPNGYPDYQHPEIRVLDINIHTHLCKFGPGTLQQDFSRYFCATLID